jgi:hypothetical protein
VPWTCTGYVWGEQRYLDIGGAQVGRVPGVVGEIVVVCTLGGGEPRGVGDTLGDSVSSRYGREGGALGICAPLGARAYP